MSHERLAPVQVVSDLDGRTVVTVEDVARLLGISRSAAYSAAQRLEFPVRRVGRRLLVPVPALRQWLGVGGTGYPDVPATQAPTPREEVNNT